MESLASYDLCQTACNVGAGTCYGSAGFVFGAVTASASVCAVIGAAVVCNTILGRCMSTCDWWFYGTSCDGGRRLLCCNNDGGEVVPKTDVEVGSWFYGIRCDGGSRLLCFNVGGEVDPKADVEVGSEGVSATVVQGAL